MKFLDVRSVKIDSTAMGGVVCYAYGYAAGNGLVNIKLVNSPGISPLFKRACPKTYKPSGTLKRF